jgi:hypothetical protein
VNELSLDWNALSIWLFKPNDMVPLYGSNRESLHREILLYCNYNDIYYLSTPAVDISCHHGMFPMHTQVDCNFL